jgi:hypothetical protein
MVYTDCKNDGQKKKKMETTMTIFIYFTDFDNHRLT